MHLLKSVIDILYLKCCLKWEANESVFFIFEKTLDIGEMTVHTFPEFILCIICIHGIMQR